MKKPGKKYSADLQKVDRGRRYPLEEALKVIRSFQGTQFDESVDIAVRLGIDPKQTDQMVRGAVSMPNGIGKSVRVLVFAKGDKADEAKAAGADYVGAEEAVEKVLQGWTEFDNTVATPDLMALVGKVGKVLGPKGLMPNPKLGTVTLEVGRAVKELKAGKVEFRTEKAGLVHALVGKKSFSEEKLKENISAFMEALLRAKPATAKGSFIRGVTLSTTMGPGVKVDVSPWVQV